MQQPTQQPAVIARAVGQALVRAALRAIGATLAILVLALAALGVWALWRRQRQRQRQGQGQGQ